MQYIGLICDSRKTKDWNFGRPSILRSVLADCLVNGDKRNLDSTEAEILYEKKTEHKEILRSTLKDNLAGQTWERSCAKGKNQCGASD